MCVRSTYSKGVNAYTMRTICRPRYGFDWDYETLLEERDW